MPLQETNLNLCGAHEFTQEAIFIQAEVIGVSAVIFSQSPQDFSLRLRYPWTPQVLATALLSVIQP
jgi:hypothetical protein